MVRGRILKPVQTVRPWLAGLAFLPFGLVAGFVVTALPFFLTRVGISLDRAAEVSATVMSPTFWAFLVTPIVDTGLSRRTWALLLGAVSSAFMAAGVWLISPNRLPWVTALMLLGELAIVLCGAAVIGLIAAYVPDESRGKAGAWVNVANLGGGALGAMVLMELSGTWSLPAVGITLGGMTLLATLTVLAFPAAVTSSLGFREIITGSVRNIWRVSTKPESLVGLALFMSPASAVAAINLFSGLGKDFNVPEQQVIWVTGIGVAIASSVGSLIGGFFADRFARGYVYLLCGTFAAMTAIIMAFGPRNPTAYTEGVLAYNFAAGLSYTAFTALALELTGTNNPSASTQSTLFSCSTNLAVVYMTWFDGQGYRISGSRGLLGFDAVASIAAAIPLLFLVRWVRRRRNRD
jgi:predicted MFS family arabinose efflux permease